MSKKWRDLNPTERVDFRDRLVFPNGTKCSAIDRGAIGNTADDWAKREPVGGKVQRRVEKRPGLTKLVKRLPEKHIIHIWHGGCVVLDSGSKWVAGPWANTDGLCAYLLTLPEVKK